MSKLLKEWPATFTLNVIRNTQKKDWSLKKEIYWGELQERRRFDFPTQCFICTQELDFEKAEKYLGDKTYQIIEVEMFDSKKAQFMKALFKCVRAGQMKFLWT